MKQEAIFIPFFGLMLLTILVWIYMYYLRLSFFMREKIDPQSVATTHEMLNLVPARVNQPSENLANLFELPVLFYATCLYLYLTQQVDNLYLVLASCFLVFRIIHSIIHCSYNQVMHRFYAYLLASLMLGVIVIRAFIASMLAW
ncbi:MAG: MAPEG family protein [Thioalkalispiraceae bacterium]|jgi:hypothetical protein